MLTIDISTPGHPGHMLLLDQCDAHLVEGVKWTPDVRPNGIVYAHRKPAGGKIYLHRLIMGAPQGMVVDHIDRNGLNNTRANLRVVSQAGNLWNTAGRGEVPYKGVWRKRAKWAAAISRGDCTYSLGVFETAEVAATAYDAAALALGYDRSGLNFPERSTGARLEPVSRELAPHGRPGIRLLSSGSYNVRVIRSGQRVGLGTFRTLPEAIEAWENENG